MNSLVIWLAVILSSMAAGVIQSVTGFGAAVVMMVVLGYVMEISQAASLVTFISLFLAGAILFQVRKSLELRRMLLPIAVFLLFSTTSILLTDYIDLRALNLAFAILLILLSVFYLFFKRKRKHRPSKLTGLACSALSGVCAGLFSMGGPTMALYFLEDTDNRASYVANLQFLFVVTGAVNFMTRTFTGLFTVDMIPLCAVGTAAILVGRVFGRMAEKRISKGVAEKIIYISVGVSGIICIVTELLSHR